MPDLALRRDLLADGVVDKELRRLRAAGQLAVVRPGAFVAADDPRLSDPDERHKLAVRAAVPHLAAGSVVSHVSAAVLHGLPVWDVDLRRVHVTRDRRSGGRRSRHVHVHAARLDSDEIVGIDGVQVTSVARTLADLARTVGFEQAVVLADAALFRHLLCPDDLAAAVERAANRSGNPQARRVAAFADRGGESPGESRSRVAMHRAGIPVPVLQHEIRSSGGVVLGRVDFWWPEFRTVGEFDGAVKYGRFLRPGQSPGDAVFAEKRREDRIRDEDHRVTRWTWDELTPFDPVAARLRHAFGWRDRSARGSSSSHRPRRL